ncbi:hypothetical protein CP533_6672, partial [Ophiocordyceps camponoti-saundersi (nom. inval.)]
QAVLPTRVVENIVREPSANSPGHLYCLATSVHRRCRRLSMSSSSQTAGSDASVLVKILYDGNTRRAKLPLREMAPVTLEQHVRAFLQIPNDASISMERYSDSAASYVVLDSDNTSIYKQLYRAAKAKSKLKLRVTVIDNDEMRLPSSSSSPSADLSSPVVVKSETLSPDVSLPMPSVTALPLRGSCPHGVSAVSSADADKEQRASSVDWRSAELQHRLSQLEERLLATSTTKTLEKVEDALSPPLTATSRPSTQHPISGGRFAVCCNGCDAAIPNAHYHCSTCDDGDFDLCQICVDHGITCYSNEHWLIKRVFKDGQLVNSTTETIASKPKARNVCEVIHSTTETTASKPKAPKLCEAIDITTETIASKPKAPNLCEVKGLVPYESYHPFGYQWPRTGASDITYPWPSVTSTTMRTCNCCVQEFPERDFLHCTVCEDFDLCLPCFAKDAHGHHPKHGFASTVEGIQLPDHIKIKMSPGRNQMHHAICDGCDKYIAGVRHKCLDCPDWDYCSECIQTAHSVHADHRFVPVYEPLATPQAWPAAQSLHHGICCDGPLCSISGGFPSYIRGVRYKCAVCHDLDFCANCEASPANTHNKTHPLIKFKTPVRHVSVTTSGEHHNGKRMPAMGDRNSTKMVANTAPNLDRNSINAVQTVVDVKPLEAPCPVKPEAPTAKETLSELEVNQVQPAPQAPDMMAVEKDLRAVFVRDSVEDGTIMAPNQVFEQTWILRNEGTVAWPAGCSVKFVGGDYMGHVDSNHPACISELVSASESTICYAPLAPGQEFSFTVLLRTPPRAGKVISYWRLTTIYGHKFGHRLWCEVNVRSPPAEPRSQGSFVHIEDVREHAPHTGSSQLSRTMVFPKLAKESPRTSLHEESTPAKDDDAVEAETKPASTAAAAKSDVEDGFDGCEEDESWNGSDDGFMTDEEYDILDASDEEFFQPREDRRAIENQQTVKLLVEQQKRQRMRKQ